MILRELKNQTQIHHSRVEECLDIMNPGLTRTRYVQILEMLFGFYSPLEARIEHLVQSVELTNDFALRRGKNALLRTDLAHFDSSIGALPLCGRLPAIASSGAALGTMYVLEGATLGGQFITRHVQQTLGLSPADGGVSFFYGYGQRTGMMWKSFQAKLIEAADHGESDAILAAAADTFEELLHWTEARAARDKVG